MTASKPKVSRTKAHFSGPPAIPTALKGGPLFFPVKITGKTGNGSVSLEQELEATRTQNEDARVQIATLTSRTALQQRLKEGYLQMIPIAEQNIVRLNIPQQKGGQDEVQPVVNQGGER